MLCNFHDRFLPIRSTGWESEGEVVFPQSLIKSGRKYRFRWYKGLNACRELAKSEVFDVVTEEGADSSSDDDDDGDLSDLEELAVKELKARLAKYEEKKKEKEEKKNKRKRGKAWRPRDKKRSRK